MKMKSLSFHSSVMASRLRKIPILKLVGLLDVRSTNLPDSQDSEEDSDVITVQRRSNLKPIIPT